MSLTPGPWKRDDATLIAAFLDLLAACKLAKQHLDALRFEAGIGHSLTEQQKLAFVQADEVLIAAIAKAENG